MNSVAKSLRCLCHPLSLVSLILLLLNDHVFKFLSPSWLTGKLSDFAGLFFFPFLLAALIAFVLREKLNTRQVGLLAFGITAVWFASMKTTAWGNALTEDFASFVLQTRAQIIQDPTDVIALGVMFPAWTLWEKTKTTRPPKWAWLVLLVAAFASMGTPAPPLAPSVNRVLAQGDKFIVTGSSIPLAESIDGGQTWIVKQESFPPNAPLLDSTRGLCEPNLREVCYRLSNDYLYKMIEQTSNGGSSWKPEWEQARGRLILMERLGPKDCVGCASAFEPGPFGLALGAPFGVDGRATLIAALGTEGVLVKTPEGDWKQYAVGKAVPTPRAISSLGQLDVIGQEIEIGMYGGLVAFVLMVLFGWRLLIGSGLVNATRPLIVSVGIMLLGAVLFEIFPIRQWRWGSEMWSFIGWPAYPVIACWLFIAAWASLYWVEKRGGNSRQAEQVLGVAISSAAVVTVASNSILCLWAFGLIEEYQFAINAAVLLAILVLGVCILTMFLLVRRNYPKV